MTVFTTWTICHLNQCTAIVSLRHRRNLTSVSNICEAMLISLFWAPNGIYKLLEVLFQFPFILTGKSTSLYTGGPENKDFGAVSHIQRQNYKKYFLHWLINYLQTLAQSLFKEHLFQGHLSQISRVSPLNRGFTELKTFLAHQVNILTCNYPEKVDKTIFEPYFWYKLGLDLSHLCLKFFWCQGLEFIVFFFVIISVFEEWFRSEVQKAGQRKLQISAWNRVWGLQEAWHKAQLNFPGISPSLPPPPLASGWSVNTFPYLEWWLAQQNITWLFHCATSFLDAIVCRDHYRQQNLTLKRGVSKWLFAKNNWQKL